MGIFHVIVEVENEEKALELVATYVDKVKKCKGNYVKALERNVPRLFYFLGMLNLKYLTFINPTFRAGPRGSRIWMCSRDGL
jgi:hypothetical protein